MHRIDSTGALPGGQFTDGNPGSGVPATRVVATWLGAVQEELCAVIEAAGLTLAKPNNGQLLAALAVMFSRAVPVGQVIQGYWTTAPTGFLLCDGSTVSRSAYPALWAHVQAAGLVVAEGTWASTSWGLFGQGDGSATFRVPDLRAEFVRGADMGRGIDAGRAVGVPQGDAYRAHTHPLSDNILTEGLPGGGLGGTTSGSSGVPVETGASGGSETRPRNVALAFAVRF
jgi:phage-related tail fiber protein